MQERMKRSHEQSTDATADVEQVQSPPPVLSDGERIKDDIDELLDEIDDVLESNAEEFVKNYVQKGGE